MADELIPQQQDQMINVIDPEGQLGSIPQSQLSQAQNSGYTPASDKDVHEYTLQEKYGSGPEQAKAFLEGLGRGTTFGLSTGLEKGFGVKPESIRGREEANPLASQAGEIAGIAGSSFIPGVGEAGLLNKAGTAVSEGLGLGGAGAISKIGSSAVKGAIETAMVQGGDEVSRMFAEDPNQTAETALTDIGLSGLMGAGIGGAFGTINPLWKATTGGKLEQFLDSVKKRANGEAAALPADVREALATSGLDNVPAEIRTVLSKDPEYQRMWGQLQESQTRPGLEAQKSLADFRKSTSDHIVNSLGKSVDELPNLTEMSENEIGSTIKKQLSKTISDEIDPLSKKFEEIKAKFKDIPVGLETKAKIAEDLSVAAQKEGFHISPGSAQNKLFQTVISDLENVKTVEDMRKLQSIIGQNYDVLNTKGLNQASKMINTSLRNTEESLVESAAAQKSPQLLGEIKAARTAYGKAMNVIDELNDRLRVGNYGGPKSFVNALKEMGPEDILRRLNPKNDADVIGMLKVNFPETFEEVRNFHLNNALKSASMKAPEGQAINTKTFFNALDKMSPEMKKFILPEGSEAKLDAIRTIMDSLPAKMNPSGTAKTLDKLWDKLPGSAVALGSMLTGHNPAMGFLLGQTAKWLGRDAPDAIRLAFLKFLGHSGPVEPEAFKSLVDFAAAAIKGETALNKATKNIFKAGAEVFPRNKLPTEQDKKRLDKKLLSFNADSTPLLNTGGKTSYYLPDHNGAMSEVAARANNYLNSLRPSTDKPGILDPNRQPSSVEKANYSRALSIADQPLSVLQYVKNGMVTPQDIMTLRTIYPNLYQKMSNKIMTDMTDHIESGKVIPYSTRIGLSMFLAQPMDSTFAGPSIAANQPMPESPQQQQLPKKAPRGTNSLMKLPASYMTADQARAAEKMKS